MGGNKGEQIADIAVHGGTAGDQISMINGLSMQHTLFTGSGFYRLEFYDPEMTQELNIVADAGNGEVQSAGVQVNMVTKSGSNDWHFHFATNGTDSRFENTNLDANLIARGVKTPPGVKDIYSIGGGAGGQSSKTSSGRSSRPPAGERQRMSHPTTTTRRRGHSRTRRI